jgi:predicted PurR-regulated permease PerM
VALLYIIVQQLENNFIVPAVMRQSVGLSPIITITLLLIGYTISGVMGAILSIPIYLAGKILFIEIRRLHKLWE